MKLRVSDSLSLPLDTVTDTLGVLAVKGGGKTYTFLVLVEEMVKQGQPVVVLDPVGVCWGLRSSADGKGPGLDVVIVGGQHGDLPLEEGSGSVLADWIIAERRSVVFDLSGLPTKAASIRFALDFLSRLYQAADRRPIHVVLDEADDFAPQKPFGEETRLLRAVEVLVRRGRAKGIGVTMVTQRPAVLSKNVLTQIGTLIVGTMRAPQDRKAVEEWVNAHATADQKKTFMTSLASLPTREKWIWSPARDVFARVTVRRRETFDSSSTPKVGEVRVEPKQLAPVDLKALRSMIESTIEKAKADDPKALRARIADLERRLSERSETVREIEVPVLAREVVDAARLCIQELDPIATELSEKLTEIRESLDRAEQQWVAGASRKSHPAPPPLEQASPEARSPRRSGKPNPAIDGSKLGKCARTLLNVLAARAPGPTTLAQLAVLSGYSIKSSSLANAVGELRSHGLATPGQPLYATNEGRRAAGQVSPLPSGRALLNHWVGQMGKADGTLLSTIYDAHPRELPKSELASRAGYSLTSSSFANALGKLRTLELVERGSTRLGAALAESHR